MGLMGADRPRGSDLGSNVAVSVGTTATLLKAANKARIAVTVQPTDGDVFVGYSSAVTISTGLEVVSGAELYEPDYTGDVYAVASTGTVNVRVAEVG